MPLKIACLPGQSGEPEVAHLDVPVAVEDQVLRLEVAVDDRLGVHQLEGEDDRRGVELGRLLVEPAGLAQEGEQLAAQGLFPLPIPLFHILHILHILHMHSTSTSWTNSSL